MTCENSERTTRPFFSDCVSWPKDRMDVLHHLIGESEELDLSSFRALVGKPAEKVFRSCGYDHHLRVEDDYHVRFRRDPISGIPFMVHSAIEYVFARKEEIDALQRRLDGTHSAPLLVVVHPGSMVGSARMNLGRREADAARDAVFEEIRSHDGGILVIDGALSDELSRQENETLQAALARAGAAGQVALRVWGDDGGEVPYPGWVGAGDPGAGLVHDGQEEAAHALFDHADLTCDLFGSVTLTGAWASEDGDGCVNAVRDVFLARLNGLAPVAISDTALTLDEEMGCAP